MRTGKHGRFARASMLALSLCLIVFSRPVSAQLVSDAVFNPAIAVGDWYLNLPEVWLFAPPCPLPPSLPNLAPNNDGQCSYFVQIPSSKVNLSLSATVNTLDIGIDGELDITIGSLTSLAFVNNLGTLKIAGGSLIAGANFLNTGRVALLGGAITAASIENIGESTSIISPAVFNISGIGSITAASLVNNQYGEMRLDAGVLTWGVPLLTNDGLIKLETDESKLLVSSGAVEIFGSGQMVLDAADAQVIAAQLGNYGSHLIKGQGKLDIGILDNEGTILANEFAGTLSINSTSILNGGNLLAANAGRLKIDTSSLGSGGLIQANSALLDIDVNGGTFTNGGLLQSISSSMNITDAVIDNAGGIIDVGSASTATLINTRVRGGNLGIDATSTLTMDGNSELRDISQSGDINVNSGTIDLVGSVNHDGNIGLAEGVSAIWQASGSNAPLLTGSGTLILDGPNTTMNSADGSINDNTHTIRGQGTLGYGTGENRGLVAADRAGGQMLVSTGVITNTGIFRAENGATMNIRPPSSVGTINNFGGTLEALTNSVIDLRLVRVNDGLLRTTGNGVIRSSGGVELANVNINGTYQTLSGQTTSLFGVIDHSGDFLVEDMASADFRSTDPAFTGTGTTTLLGPNAALTSSFGTLTHDLNRTLQGEGIWQGTMANLGTIDANVNGGLLQTRGDITNTGTLRASSGGTLELTTTSSFDEIFNAGGVIEALDNSTVKLRQIYINDGLLRTTGNGEIVTNGASIRLINTTIDGTYRTVSGQTTSLFGVIDHSGDFLVEDGAIAAFRSTDPTFTGTGTTTLLGPNATLTSSFGTLTHTAGRTLQGEGIWQGTMANLGTIDANVNGGQLQTRGDITNTGTLRASSGGTLELTTTSSFDEIFNAGGVIEALDNSTVKLRQIYINDGLLRTAGSGEIVTNGASIRLINTTIDGTYRTVSGQTTSLFGSIDHSGDFLVEDGAIAAFRSTDPTFTGTGTTTLLGPNATLTSSFGTLTHTTGRTLQGEGIWQGNMANLGTIDANVNGGQLRISGNITNTGIVRASNGGVLDIRTGIFDNTAGIIEARTDSVTRFGGIVTLTGGQLNTSGSGRFEADGSTALVGATLNGPLRVTPGHFLHLQGASTNNGEIEIQSGASALVAGPVSGSGDWIADDGKIEVAANQAVTSTGDVSIKNGGELLLRGGASMTANNFSVTAGGKVIIQAALSVNGTVQFDLQDESLWSFNATASLAMTGGQGSVAGDWNEWGSLEIGGIDIGIDPANHVGDPAGFSNNFDLTELIIGADAHVFLTELTDNGNRGGTFGLSEALYVDTLIFADANSTLNLNGYNIYYKNLVGDIGQIIDMQVVPVPPAIWLFGSALGWLGWVRRLRR